MFQTKVVEKIKTHILFSITLSWNLYHLWDNVEKYGRARQVTDDNIMWHMCFVCWITEATNTHLKYVILIAFPWQQWLRECASSVMFIHTLPILLPLVRIMKCGADKCTLGNCGVWFYTLLFAEFLVFPTQTVHGCFIWEIIAVTFAFLNIYCDWSFSWSFPVPWFKY